MMHKQRIWDIKEYNKEKASCFAAELGISPLVTGILLERGVNSIDAMRDFLYGSAQPFHDPFLLKDMQRSVERITRALAAGEKLTVYGDYDVDGITASSLLYLYLKGRGAQVQTYIPQRKSEGYGLNDEALRTIAEGGSTLVITVDCGISGLHEVQQAPECLDIIITDHHTVPPELPPAYAIINAKQADCAYPFKELSGVGIAFKLCQALEQGAPGSLPAWQGLTELAAMGTVADIVPLVGENRELVRRGLKAMETTQLVGLRALIKASGCPQENIAADNIGFGLAPRLNAVGRLEHAQLAVELLVTQDAAKAEAIAEKLNKENSLRQEICRQIMEEAEELLAQEQHIDTAIVLASSGWHQGVIGIVASRLVEKYHLPTILISLSDDGMAKGSCRSIPALNLYEAIAAERDILTQFGGHHQAAGLTLPAAKVPEFRERFRAYVAAQLQPEDYLPHQTVDCVVSGTGEITEQDLQQLALLEPCGCENTPPVFAFHKAVLHNERAMGKERNHLQFSLDKGDFSYRCVMWNNADLLPFLFDGAVADVAFQPKLNVWNNERSVQLHVSSLRQPLTVGDFRRGTEDRFSVLRALARVQDRLTVYVSSATAGSMMSRWLQDNQDISGYLDIRLYSSFSAQQDESLQQTVILLELPPYPLKQFAAQLKKQGAKSIMLLFDHNDYQREAAQLMLTHPDRAAMATAYKLVMHALGRQAEVAFTQLLEKNYTQISENAVKIMEQLGFISYNNGIIKKGVINRCSLEDSPLYVSLQQERAELERTFQENIRLNQHDLLRG